MPAVGVRGLSLTARRQAAGKRGAGCVRLFRQELAVAMYFATLQAIIIESGAYTCDVKRCATRMARGMAADLASSAGTTVVAAHRLLAASSARPIRRAVHLHCSALARVPRLRKVHRQF